MLKKTQLTADFEAILGWPYQSPGTNNEKGIDCSGAFVRAYRKQGKRIYHGSNTIYRKHCKEVGDIEQVADLQVGMAVFKHRTDGKEPKKYQKDGRGNLYHIGLVTQVNPLRIVHATAPKAKADDCIGTWSHWGKLTEVDYEGGGTVKTATVNASSGLTVNLREKPNGALIVRVPIGARVTVGEAADGWTYAVFDGYHGYMMSRYLLRHGQGKDGINKSALLEELKALLYSDSEEEWDGRE